MKKIISILLAFCLATNLVTTAFAATMSVVTAPAKIKAGESVTVTISLDEAIENVVTYSYELYFNGDLFTLASSTKGSSSTLTTLSKLFGSGEKSYYKLSVVDPDSQGVTINAGDVYTLVFTAKADIAVDQSAAFKLEFKNCKTPDYEDIAGVNAGPAVTITVEHTHKYNKTEAVAATCVKDGNIEYYTCTCGKCFKLEGTEYTEIDKTATVISKETGSHALEKVNAVVPTNCSTDAVAEHYKCKLCGKLFTDNMATTETTLNDLTTKASHLNVVVVAVKEATCTKDGMKAHYKCSTCGKLFTNEAATDETTEAALKIPAAHTLAKTEAKAATCTADGNNEYWTCSTCGKMFKTDKTTETTVAAETIPAGHVYEFVNEVAATCNKTGTEAHYKCENCLQLFKNDDAKTPVNAEDLVLAINPNKHTGSQTLQHNETQHWYHCGDCEADYSKANHSGGTATCTEQAKCTTCSQPYGALKAHTLNKTPAKAATCTEAGNAAYWTCSSCNKVFKDEAGNTETSVEAEKIAALGHQMTKTEAVAPTCTEDGTLAYWTCSNSCCDGIKFGDEDGKTMLTSIVDPAKGHKMTKTEAVAPTCTVDGNNAYWTCGTCNKVFKDEAGNAETSVEAEKIAALGHEYGTQIDEVPATCTKEGTKAHYKCSRCEKLFLDTTSGDTVTASDLVIDKIRHDYKGIYNETHHWTFCVNCGATTDKAAHDFTVDEATGTKTCNCGYVVYGEGTVPCDQHDTELVFDETHHWHVCKNCSYAEDKDAHGFGDWETDVEATTTTDGLRHRTCKECGYVQQEVIAKPSTTPSTRPTTRPSGGSNATSSDKVKSSKTFDAGIAAYVGLSVLSLTGSALVIGKKKEF